MAFVLICPTDHLLIDFSTGNLNLFPLLQEEPPGPWLLFSYAQQTILLISALETSTSSPFCRRNPLAHGLHFRAPGDHLLQFPCRVPRSPSVG